MATSEYIEEETSAVQGPLLSKFGIDGLFGRYSYDVAVPYDGEAPGRLLLLHGENGSGKTTVLRLLWNALSAAADRGHRTSVAQIPFRHFYIDFANGSRLEYLKVEGLIGSYDVQVFPAEGEAFIAKFRANERGVITGGAPRSIDAETWERLKLHGETSRLLDLGPAIDADPDENRLTEFLQKLVAAPLFLADDRSLYADDLELERLRDQMRAQSAGERHGPRVTTKDLVSRELQITLRRVNDWLRTLTLRGQNVGSAGANTIYQNVLQQLAAQLPVDANAASGKPSEALRLLAELRVRTPRFERYGLVPNFDANTFESLLRSIGPDRRQLAQDIVIPYLDSLSTRYDALEEAEQKLTALLSTCNSFLSRKSLDFSPRSRDSLRIVADDGEVLSPDLLSSGERQLMTLVCTTFLAGRDSRIFFIDEPELSLGVPWQRRILASLLDLTEGGGLQFVVATHSIEVISTRLESLVPLSG